MSKLLPFILPSDIAVGPEIIGGISPVVILCVVGIVALAGLALVLALRARHRK